MLYETNHMPDSPESVDSSVQKIVAMEARSKRRRIEAVQNADEEERTSDEEKKKMASRRHSLLFPDKLKRRVIIDGSLEEDGFCELESGCLLDQPGFRDSKTGVVECGNCTRRIHTCCGYPLDEDSASRQFMEKHNPNVPSDTKFCDECFFEYFE